MTRRFLAMHFLKFLEDSTAPATCLRFAVVGVMIDGDALRVTHARRLGSSFVKAMAFIVGISPFLSLTRAENTQHMAMQYYSTKSVLKLCPLAKNERLL